MPVKVILKEDIETLGKAGELVTVKPGYARNYLIPRGVAVVATLQNLVWLKEHREKLQQEANQKRQAAEALKAILEGLGEITINAQVGPTGQLYGRINNQVLADEFNSLSEGKLSLDRKDVVIAGHAHGIDELGTYTAVVNFGLSVKANVTVNVVEG